MILSLQTGVGKSSLINEYVGVTEVVRLLSYLGKSAPEAYPSQNASHSNAGISTINTAIMAKENGRFVLHDSQGFGHGDGENFKNVVDFLKDRKDMPNVRGQVHAVWYVYRSSIILKKGDQGVAQALLDSKPVALE